MMNKISIFLAIGSMLATIALATSCAPSLEDLPSLSPFTGSLFGLIGLGLYFLPTIVAAATHKKHLLGIVLLNVFAGWTIIGWVIALAWAVLSERS